MEMQQIMELLLAKTDAETEAIRAEMKATRNKRMEANRNAWRKEAMACLGKTKARPE
jgi:hypothetical protein